MQYLGHITLLLRAIPINFVDLAGSFSKASPGDSANSLFTPPEFSLHFICFSLTHLLPSLYSFLNQSVFVLVHEGHQGYDSWVVVCVGDRVSCRDALQILPVCARTLFSLPAILILYARSQFLFARSPLPPT